LPKGLILRKKRVLLILAQRFPVLLRAIGKTQKLHSSLLLGLDMMETPKALRIHFSRNR
jgi:hypothetical protein